MTGVSVRLTETDEKYLTFYFSPLRSKVFAFQDRAISAVLTEEEDSIEKMTEAGVNR
jgi:hypothetical protein